MYLFEKLEYNILELNSLEKYSMAIWFIPCMHTAVLQGGPENCQRSDGPTITFKTIFKSQSLEQKF